MKELPYFRFTVQEWQNGDIALESYELKGLFIDVCGFYWLRNCEVDFNTLSKRFSNATAQLEKLVEIGCIKVDDDGNWIEIEFLYEQYKILTNKQRKLSKAGKLGGIASAKARVKQKVNHWSSYKDKEKDKEKDNTPRKHSFAKSPYFDRTSFKKALPDWSNEKLRHWYQQACDYSEVNGGKYLDWVKAVQKWDRSEPFKEPREANSHVPDTVKASDIPPTSEEDREIAQKALKTALDGMN